MLERIIGRAALCALAIASLPACDGTVEDSTTSEATSCTPVGTSTWWNQAFAAQTGRFHVELSAVPSAANLDAIVGLSNGATSKWASLAAIVRFSPQGTIDARAGSVYRADREYRYAAGTTYYVRLDVDVKTRTYSVWVSASSPGAYVAIAREYPFRTEQAAITQVTNAASFVNPATGPGTLQVCGLTATTDATTADGCVINTTGSGFTNVPIASSSTVQKVSLVARAQRAGMDGVIGVTSGNADAYDDYAAALRFWTNGRVEARDGDAYGADRVMPYVSGQQFDIQFVIDLPSKTYSVFVRSLTDATTSGAWVELARGYRFRPQQANVPMLDRVATIVASPTGRLDTCQVTGGPNPKLRAARDGTFDVLPLSNNGAWISNGVSATRLDSNHRPTASLPVGGKLALDAAGNLYLASISNAALAVRSYTPALAQRFFVSYPVSGGAVGEVTVTSTGQIALLIGDRPPDGAWTDFVPRSYVRLAANGNYLAATGLPVGTTAAALSATQVAVARGVAGGVAIERYAYGSAAAAVSRTVAGAFTVTRMMLGADNSIVIGGSLSSVDFGTGVLRPFSPGDDSGVYWDAYLAAFTANLTTRFSHLMTSTIEDIATNGREIAVSYLTLTQLEYVYVTVYDASGAVLRDSTEDAFVGWFGEPGAIAIGPAGQVYLNELVSLGGPADAHFPFLATLSL